MGPNFCKSGKLFIFCSVVLDSYCIYKSFLTKVSNFSKPRVQFFKSAFPLTFRSPLHCFSSSKFRCTVFKSECLEYIYYSHYWRCTTTCLVFSGYNLVRRLQTTSALKYKVPTGFYPFAAPFFGPLTLASIT